MCVAVTDTVVVFFFFSECMCMLSLGVTEIIRQQQLLVQKLTQVQQDLAMTQGELTASQMELGRLRREADEREESFAKKWREREAEFEALKLQKQEESMKKADDMELWQSELSKLRSEASAIRDAISRVRSRSPSGHGSGRSTPSTGSSSRRRGAKKVGSGNDSSGMSASDGSDVYNSEYEAAAAVVDAAHISGEDAMTTKEHIEKAVTGTNTAPATESVFFDATTKASAPVEREPPAAITKPAPLLKPSGGNNTRSTSRGKTRSKGGKQAAAVSSSAMQSGPKRGRTPVRSEDILRESN